MTTLSDPNLPALLRPHVERLEELYAAMDDAYARAAAAAGFHCSGCEENCCRSRFYHHTYLEWLAIRRAVARLPADEQDAIRHRARRQLEAQRRGAADGSAPRELCPLNQAQRCRIYPHRPMICRLHGVPHRLLMPTGQWRRGPGCALYETTCAGRAVEPLDRTPLYRRLAELETRVRRSGGVRRKFKLTIAEIILDREQP